MRKALVRKLKSESGASLMVALLFFVFMAVVGSVILAAASSSVGRVKNEDQGDQERYALYSAANLMVDRLAGKNIFDNVSNDDCYEVKSTDNNEGINTFYIDGSTGKYTNDSELNGSLNLENITWPDLELDNKNAKEIADIGKILGRQILKEYWQGQSTDALKPTGIIPNGWVKNESVYWNKENASPITKSFSFDLKPSSDWGNKADTKYIVRADVSMNEHFDIKIALSLEDKSKNTDNGDIIGKKYYVKIPFSSDAKIEYVSDPIGVNPVKYSVYCKYDSSKASEWLDANEDYIPVNEPIGSYTIEKYKETDQEYRVVRFRNFKWQNKEEATITTVENLADIDGPSS